MNEILKKNYRYLFFYLLLLIFFLGVFHVIVNGENYKRNSPPNKNQSNNIPFETIDKGKGRSSNYHPTLKEKVVLVNNKQEWKELWNLLYSNQFPKKPLPLIDFKQDMIIGVFLGPSGGFDRVEIVNVQVVNNNRQDEFRIQAIKQVPNPECMVISVVTHPFHIIVGMRKV